MMRRAPFALSLLLWVALPAFAELYTVNCNVPVQLILPLQSNDDEPSGYIKAKGAEAWQPLPLQVRDGRLHLTIDPARFAARDILVLVNPPPGRNIHDTTAPRLNAVSVDGSALAADADWTPGLLGNAPRVFRWHVEDAGNALDPGSLAVKLDGNPLSADQLDVHIDGARGTITARLGRLEYGEHRLLFRIADDAPEANALTWEASFNLFDESNLIRAGGDHVQVAVDSHFENYPSIAPLTDGVRSLPGSSAGNDVTWASAESNTPHWIDVTLPEAAPLREVTVYWARPNSASRNVDIQIWKDGGWHSVSNTPVGGYSQRHVMTFAFDPVTARRFRIWQPAGGGSPSRPNLMWVTEIEAR